jgi:hypothetical protein
VIVTNMVKAPTNTPSFVPERRITYLEKRRSEINLSGPGSNWIVHFAEKRDLSDAITFRRGGDDAQFAGTSRHTLSIFGVDGSIKVRDSRSVTVRRRDREGRMANSEQTVWASVEIRPRDFEVVHHEEMGDDWITLIELRPGRAFMVRISPTTRSNTEDPLPISHDMLRLWNRRSEIRAMRCLAIVVRDHRNYVPWILVLQREMLGPTVTPAVAESEMQLPEVQDPDAEPLIDLWSDELPSAPSTVKAGDAQTEPPIDLLSDGPAEEARHDPFQGIWEHAMDLAKSGNSQEESEKA